MTQPIGELLTPPKKERLPETIAAQLKSLFYSKKIACGEKLPAERELADMLEVSRVVVKQAMMLLEQSGFVEIKRGPKGGAFVINRQHKPFTNFINDLFAVGELSHDHFCNAREANECRSIALAVKRATTADIDRIEHINREFLEDLNDIECFANNNARFHIAIAEISGNPLILGIVQSLMDHHRAWRTSYPDMNFKYLNKFIKDTYDRHEAIIAAIKAKDESMAQKLIAKDVGPHQEIVECFERAGISKKPKKKD